MGLNLNSVYQRPYIVPDRRGGVKRREEDEQAKQTQQERETNQTDQNARSKGLDYVEQKPQQYQVPNTPANYPNAVATALAQRSPNINIAQILKDFKNTAIAIGTPEELKEEVQGYLELIEKQITKEEPNTRLIKSNLKNAATILDNYISQTLNKDSKVVENWVDALFLQQIDFKYDEQDINPDFLVKFPEECKKQVEELEKKLQKLVEDKNANIKTIEELQQELRSINVSSTELTRLQNEILGATSNSNGTTTTTNEDEEAVNQNEEAVDPNNTEEVVNNNSSANTNNNGVTIGDRITNVGTVGLGDDIIGAGIDDPEVAKVADKLYRLIDGTFTGGTNGDIKDFTRNNINKDNVVEVMLYWNKNYAQGYAGCDPLGITESIFDDFAAFGKDAVRPFITALQQRLKDYQGVNPSLYSEASSQLSIAEKEAEPSSWYEFWKICDEDKTSAAINKAHRAIVQLMIEKEQQAQGSN